LRSSKTNNIVRLLVSKLDNASMDSNGWDHVAETRFYIDCGVLYQNGGN
jgi:hypothetical protein